MSFEPKADFWTVKKRKREGGTDQAGGFGCSESSCCSVVFLCVEVLGPDLLFLVLERTFAI